MDEKYGLSGRTSLNFVSTEKLKHDIEQFEYLIGEGKLDSDTRWGYMYVLCILLFDSSMISYMR